MKSTSNGGERLPRQSRRVDSIKARKSTRKAGGALSQIITQLVVAIIFFGLMTVAVMATTDRTVVYKAKNEPQSTSTAPVEQSIKTEDKVPQKSKIEAKKTSQTVTSDHQEKMAEHIAETFNENPVTMVAIALAENRQLDPKKTNYNCRYKIGGDTYDKLTQTYIDLNTVSKERLSGYVSTWCRAGQEQYAWSKDGGLMQVNNPKPEHYTVSGNLSEARKRYDEKGLNAWTTYWTKEYLENIEQAKKLLE